MAEQNYGKFSNTSSIYPYQLWEPDSQEDYLTYIDIYKNTIVTETNEVASPHPAGFHFAINVDIAMFDVYTSGASGRSIHTPVFPAATTPVVVNIPTGADSGTATKGDGQDSAVFLTVFTMPSTSDDTLALYMSMIEYMNATSMQLVGASTILPRSDWLLESTSQSTATTAALLYNGEYSSNSNSNSNSSSNTQEVVIVMDSGRLIVLNGEMSMDMSSVEFTSSWNSTVFSGERVVYDMAAVPFNTKSNTNTNTIATPNTNAYVIVSKTEDNVLMLNYIEITTDTGSIELLHELSMLLEMSVEFSSSINIKHDDITSCTVEYLDTGATTLGLVCAMDGTVWSSVTTIDISVDIDTVAVEFVPLSVGNTVDLSVLLGTGTGTGTDTDGVIMLNVGDGYCYNAHHKNTRAVPSVCTASGPHIHSTPHVLDYSIGLLSDWVDLHADNTDKTLTGDKRPGIDSLDPLDPLKYAITSCSPSILHGSYDQGKHPAVALGRINGESIFIELHEGLEEKTSGIPGVTGVPSTNTNTGMSMSMNAAIDNGCGVPNAYNGIVMDSFYIDSWIQSLHNNI